VADVSGSGVPPRPAKTRLTKPQREALTLLRAHPDDAYCVAPGGGTFLDGSQVAVDWKTALALKRRGLVDIDNRCDGTDIFLTDRGRDV
jgi:hypothetical protein